MRKLAAMRPGRLLPLTVLLSFVLQAIAWFFPAQTLIVADMLGKFHLPVEQNLMTGRSAISRVVYSFGDLMLICGFCQTIIFRMGHTQDPRRPRTRSRSSQIFGLLGGGAMLSGLVFGLWAGTAAGLVPIQSMDIVQIISPSLSFGSGVLLAAALLTSRLSPDAHVS